MSNNDQAKGSLPKALVTGAAGFIGSHVTRHLLASKRVQIVALDDLTGGVRENVPIEVTFIEGSITDKSLINRIFEEHDFRFVYHLAAYAAEGLSHFIRHFNYTNNVLGSINLINASLRHEVECFVFTSSIAVFGAVTPPMREDQPPHPEDPYGIAKLAVEFDLRAAHQMFGLQYCIFRPHNVYGEFQNLGDPYRNVIGIFMNQILSGKPMTIFGDGKQQRAFSYIGDIAPAIAEAPWVKAARNEVINLGADQPYTVNELAACVARVMGVPDHPVEHLPQRNEVQVAYSDHSKFQRIFGNHAQTSLQDGLSRMAVWAKSAGVHSGKPFSSVEIVRNMPESWRRLIAN